MKKLTMPRLVVGTAADASDLHYASGFTAPDPVVFLQDGRRKYLVVSKLEVGRARRVAAGCRVLLPDEVCPRAADRRRLSGWALGLLAYTGTRRVAVSSTFPAGVMDRLTRKGIRVTVLKEPLYPERAVKNEREIRYMRSAQRAAVKAVRAGVAEIRKARVDDRGMLMVAGRKLTSEHVRFVIESELLRHQCACPETIVAGGRQGADPHERGLGALRAGYPIVIDVFPKHRVHGYCGDITRTVYRGALPEKTQRMFKAVAAAQRAALSRVRAGVMASTVHRAADEEIRRHGFATGMRNGKPEGFFHSTGHGIGLDVHEFPSVSTAKTRLRAGHVITIEPGLYYPREGGVRIEDTVVVTKTGYEYLAACPKRIGMEGEAC